MLKSFADDDPRVLSGEYDVFGFNRKERAAAERKRKQRVQCDHKFIDSTKCLKCGWIPPEPKA